MKGSNNDYSWDYNNYLNSGHPGIERQNVLNLGI